METLTKKELLEIGGGDDVDRGLGTLWGIVIIVACCLL